MSLDCRYLKNLRHAALFVLATILATLLPSKGSAQNIVCSPVGPASINFGMSDTATGSIGFNCRNFSNAPANIRVCIGIGFPSFPGSVAQPQMLRGNATLNFNLFTDPATTRLWTMTTPISMPVSIAAPIGSATSGSLQFYGRIAPGQNAPPGQYRAFFFNTVLGFQVAGSTTCQSNPAPNLFGQDFTLSVRALRTPSCTVLSEGPVDLGSVPTTASGTAGTTSVRVDCPNGTPYFIGLSPSNGNVNGAGQLTGSAGNPDRPLYQLRSQSQSGPIWGNTATSTSVGNGVAGTGTGSPQSIPVFVTLPSAAVTPDEYSDTVTVNVNF